MMTCNELLEIARKGRPTIRYARNATATAIAAWWDNHWVPVASITIDGRWVELPGELLINGVPASAGEVWTE